MQTEIPGQNTYTDPHVAEAVDNDVDESLQSPTPGAVLQAERLRLNLSEKDISDQLHITMHYVRAIESNRFDKLPGAVFAKGYIKSYALLLGLEASTVTALFDGINSEQQEMKDEATRRHQARRRSDRNKPWVYASVACFVLGFGGLWAYNTFSDSQAEPQVAPRTQTPAPATIASRPIAQTPEPIIAEEISAPLSGAQLPGNTTEIPINQTQQLAIVQTAIVSSMPALDTENFASTTTQSAELAVPGAVDSVTEVLEVPVSDNDENHIIAVGASGDDVLLISFTGESWVEVNDSQSKQIYRDIRTAGDVLEITGDAPFSILLGDAPFTQMFLNGDEINVSDNIRIDNSARLTVGL